MATGYYIVRDTLAREMNEQTFSYIDPGLETTKAFVSDFLKAHGYIMTVFKMEELTGMRRHLHIWFKDVEYLRGYFIDFTIQDFNGSTSVSSC